MDNSKISIDIESQQQTYNQLTKNQLNEGDETVQSPQPQTSSSTQPAQKSHSAPTPKGTKGQQNQQAQSANGGNGATAPAPQVNNLYKTQLCKHFQQTKHCHVGNKCHFAHGENEFRKKEEALPVEVQMKMLNIPYNNFKTQKCKFFFDVANPGVCKYGKNCSYAHGDTDVRKPYANVDLEELLIQHYGPGGPGEEEIKKEPYILPLVQKQILRNHATLPSKEVLRELQQKQQQAKLQQQLLQQQTLLKQAPIPPQGYIFYQEVPAPRYIPVAINSQGYPQFNAQQPLYIRKADSLPQSIQFVFNQGYQQPPIFHVSQQVNNGYPPTFIYHQQSRPNQPILHPMVPRQQQQYQFPENTHQQQPLSYSNFQRMQPQMSSQGWPQQQPKSTGGNGFNYMLINPVDQNFTEEQPQSHSIFE